MANHGFHNEILELDNGQYACEYVWRSAHWGEVHEERHLLGCMHKTRAQAEQHLGQMAQARAVLMRVR